MPGKAVELLHSAAEMVSADSTWMDCLSTTYPLRISSRCTLQVGKDYQSLSELYLLTIH